MAMLSVGDRLGWNRCGHALIVAPPGDSSIKIGISHPERAKEPHGVNWPPVMAVPFSNSETKLIRFSVFEVDLAAGELRKNGRRIRLQEQPFQVLVALLENAGQVVTREDLRQKIWPADTFVDFDHSLNTAVNKVREALGDSASSPRFVETLARRGYRFIAPLDDQCYEDRRFKDARSGASATERASVVTIPLHPDLHVPIPHRGLVRALFALIQIMYLCFYLTALGHLHGVERAANTFLGGRKALFLVGVVLVTAAVGIPLRFYLLSSVAFDFRRLGVTFWRLFPFLLVFDQLWAIAPFLIASRIGVGLAFAATAALLYVPFSERSLVRMAYLEK